MKNLFLFATLSLSLNAFATDLACFTDRPLITPNGTKTAFVINNVDGEVETTLPDQNTLNKFELNATGTQFEASFSNECDNEYIIAFPARAFKTLIEDDPTTTPIRGKVSYSDSAGTKSNSTIVCRRL
jgi:hypothetical protein